MGESVRVQRAIVDFLIKSPKTGRLSIVRSMNIWTGKERFHSARKPHTPPMTAGKMMDQYLTKTSETPMTKKVGAGRTGPEIGDNPLEARNTKKNVDPGMDKGTNNIGDR